MAHIRTTFFITAASGIFLLSPALQTSTPESERTTIAARILSVSSDRSTVVVNRGKAENVVPGSLCVIRPNRGNDEADVGWDIYFAKGVVQSSDEDCSVVKLTVLGPENLRPRDYCEIQATIPETLLASDLALLARWDIALLDQARQAPFYTLKDLIKDSSQQALGAIIDRMFEEIRSTPRAVIDEKLRSGQILVGPFVGLTLHEVFRRTERQDIEKFIEYMAWFPARLVNYDLVFIEVYAGWAFAGAPSGEGQKKKHQAAPAVSRGNNLIAAGKFLEALAEYDQALLIDPDNEEARTKVEAVNRTLNRQNTLEEDGKDVVTRFALGKGLFDLGLAGRALEEFQKAKALGLDTNDLDKYMGFSHAFLGQYAEAIRYLEPIADRLPEDPYLQLWLALSKESEILGQREADVSSYLARGNIRYRYGSYDYAIADFNAALEIAPQDREVWASVFKTCLRLRAREKEITAREKWRAGDLSEAIEDWTGAADICKAIGDEEGSIKISEEAATSLYESGFYDHAISIYQAILTTDPGLARIHLQIARCYVEQKDYPPAVQQAAQGLRLDPGIAWGHNILGNIYQRMRDLDLALTHFQKAVEIEPGYFSVYRNLGLVHALKGDYEKAGESFRRALDIDSGYALARADLVSVECILEILEMPGSKPYDNTARLRLAGALYNLSDYDRAISQLEEVHGSTKDVARAQEKIGLCLIQQGKYTEGKARLEESYRLDPKPDLQAWIRYGEARLLQENDPSAPEAMLELGENSLYWESYEEALSLFQKAVNLGADPNAASARRELARRGQAAGKQIGLWKESHDRSHFEKAVEYGEKALSIYRELGAKRGEFQALLRIGWSYAAQFKRDHALRHYSQAGRVVAELRLETEEARYLYSLGQYYHNLGDYGKSLEYHQKACELWHDANDLLSEARDSLPAIGWILGNLGDSKGQFAAFEKALRINRKLSDPRGETSVLLDIASVSAMQGDFSRALEFYQEAQPVAQKQNLREIAMRTYWGLGSVYTSLGDIENAQRYLQRYLETAVALGDKTERVQALNSLGLLYLEKIKDYAKAMGFFKEAMGLSRLIGYRKMEGVAAANIAVVFSRQGIYEEALRQHEEALKIVREENDQYLEMQGLNEKGETLFGLKEYDAALECQIKARDLAQFFGVRSEQWRYELAAGKVCEAKEDAARAIEFYQRAAEILRGITSRIAGEKLGRSFGEQDEQTEVYKRLIGLLLKSGKTGEAFRYIEESKSKIVKDAFGGVKPVAAEPALQQILHYVDKAEQIKEALEGELLEEMKKLPESQNAQKVETLTKTLATTESEFNQWMMKLKFQNRKMYDALSIKPSSLSDIQHLIPAGAVFLVYFISPDTLYVFSIAKELFLIRSTAVGEAEINTLVSRFLRLCQTPPSGGTAKLLPQAQRLYEILIGPVEDILARYDTAVIVPFGPLYYLPFHALVKETGGQPEYLIERMRVCYATSATFADILKGQSRGAKSFLAIGDPDGTLPAAAKEVQTLQEKIFKSNSRILVAKEATKSAFLKQAKDFDILHLATHGVVETNPLDSHLLFAGASKEEQELTLLEVAGYTALKEKNFLVFLSACQTAAEATKSGTGSELITLAEAFAMAGAPTLIATLWEVEDRSTGLLALTFYDTLMNKKKDKLEALRSGQIALIRSEEYAHPFYWASFLMIGSWH